MNKKSQARKQNIILIGIFMAFSLLVFISATITLSQISSIGNIKLSQTSTNLTNVTLELNNFTHLNVSNSSIKLYMPFDENYNSTYTFDYTNNSNDGTLKNGVVFNNTGCIYGNCYNFDGVNDYIQTNLAPSGYSAITMSAWVNLYAVGDYPIVFSYGTNAGNPPELRFYSTTGRIEFMKRVDNTGITDTVNLVGTGWHHLVGVSNGTTLTLYKDGSLVGTGAFATTIDSTTSFRIGRRSDDEGTAFLMNGSIDEAMIWDIALNSTQVSDIYKNQTQRFFPSSEQLFQNINFSTDDTINISLQSCQTNMGSSLRGKINTGAWQDFSSCSITNYAIPNGTSTNANLTIGYIGGNGSVANTFYTPLVLGNITLDSWISDKFKNVTLELSNFTHLNVSNSSIKLYMPFDENYNSTYTFDYTNNSNDGILKNGVVFNNTGCIYGNCYTFDGSNDYIDVGDINALDGITQMTVSTWIRATNPTAADDAIITKWDHGSQASWAFQLDNTNADELQVFIAASLTTDGSESGITTNSDLVANRWYNAVFVFDGAGATDADRLKIYVDGAAKTMTYPGTIPASLTSATSTVKIGRFGDSLTRYWNGNIDEVMIWNTALNSTEVLAIYNNQTQRFYPTGEQLFQNINFGENNTLNISLQSCQTNMGSSLRGKINNGAYQTFSGCNLTDYIASGTLTNANLTIGFIGGNGSVANTFYTPLVIGNITLESKLGGVPQIANISFNPNTAEFLDPGVSVTFNATVTQIGGIGINSVRLQYYNGTFWANSTMINVSANEYNTTLTLLSSNANYTFNVWANNTNGFSNQSANQTFESAYDCTWTATSDLGSTAGWDENKRIGNIILNNTGDSSYSTGCSLDFRLTYDLPEGRIYFDNVFYKPSSTITLTPGNNKNVSVNASFLSEIKSEDVIISTNELLSRTNVSQRNTTATVVSNQAGPYLFQKITSNPESVSLTAGNFSLEAYIRNLMGSTTVNANNTAYNVTFNWTLPSGITNVSGTYKTNFTNITDSELHYNNINASFSSLASMTSGVKTFYIYATGVNKTGDRIEEADGTILLKKSVNITFLCYATSDSVCVTACGVDNDPDCTASSSSTSSGGGGGGGGAGRATAVTGKSVAEYELVRGEEQKFELIIENPYLGYLENLEISVKGIRSDLIKIIPTKIEKIEAGQSKEIVVEIISPAYFTEGNYDLEFLITGNLIEGEQKRPYIGRMNVDLFIIDIPREETELMREESSKMFEQMNNSNMSLKKVSVFYLSLQKSFEERKFSEVKKSYDEIKTIHGNAFGSLELIEWLKKQIKKAEKNGISVIETKKLLYLGEATFERGDYESSIKRLEEARLTYAIETKGEFNLFYAVKNNPLESTGILFAAILFSFSSFLITKYKLYKRKLKNLEEEEKLLLELMKTVQRETFENSHFSMSAYREAMFQYETKLSEVIEDKIETETKLASLFQIKGKEMALKGEKEKLYNLVRELQKDYLQKGKIESRVYENMLKIYSTRIVEIEEKLVYIEAKQLLHNKYPSKKLKLGWFGL